MITIKEPFIYLETPNTSLVFEIRLFNDKGTKYRAGKKAIFQRYYGKRIAKDLTPLGFEYGKGGSCEDYVKGDVLLTTFGMCNNNEPSLVIDSDENAYTNFFYFDSAFIIDGGVDIKGPHARNVLKTLAIKEIDDFSHIEVIHYFSIFEDSDVIAVKKEIKNNRESAIKLDKAYSLELHIETKKVTVYSFDGVWLNERYRHETKLDCGTYVIESKSGSSSHKHNPFFELINRENGDVYGFNLIYSGNHKELVEVDPTEHTKVHVGISDFLFHYEVKPGESFFTPEAIMVVKPSLDEITLDMHAFALDHVADPKFARKERPIIFNNWEGTGMKINEQALLEMADAASEVGVEQFVMDDGWFVNREDDKGGLGDWVVDKNKFPNGLKPFVDKVRARGLKFGIWVEPEMICIKTNLYKEHPEFASIVPGRDPVERRHQLMIDMTNPAVIDYLFGSLTKVFDEIQPDYVKWDYNRFLSDNYSSCGTKKGEYFHRFIHGTYELMDRLTKRYPNTLWESCSSGGGRFDLGMLYYMPQAWGSDDSNSYCRAFIGAGSFAGYPQSSFGAHVSRDHYIIPGINKTASLEDRFNIQCFGAFGYEFDFRTYGKEERAIMAKQIEFYKQYRKLIQFGKLYVNDNPFDDERYYGLTVTDEEDAIMLVAETEKGYPLKAFKAKGLDEDAVYEITERPQYNVKEEDRFAATMTGKVIMNEGIVIKNLEKTSDAKEFGGVMTRLLVLRRK